MSYTKKSLLEQFKVLTYNFDCTYCADCTNCFNCTNCADCTDCTYCNNCTNCNNCLLCKKLHNKTRGYYLLNKEVSKEEFLEAKEALLS